MECKAQISYWIEFFGADSTFDDLRALIGDTTPQSLYATEECKAARDIIRTAARKSHVLNTISDFINYAYKNRTRDHI